MKPDTLMQDRRIATLVMAYPGGHEVSVRVYLDLNDHTTVRFGYWASWSIPATRDGGACYRTVTTGDHPTLSGAVCEAIERIQASQPV